MPPSNSTHYEFYLSVLFQKTMGVTGASLSLCVFLCLMPVCPADNLTASDMSTTISTATNGTSQTAIFDEKDKCLIDNQTGWIDHLNVETVYCSLYKLHPSLFL